MSGTSDNADMLISRAQGGDQEAWRELVTAYAPEMRRRIRKRLSPRLRRRVSESDVLQEAWQVVSRRWFIDRLDPIVFGLNREWLNAAYQATGDDQ